MLKYAGWTCRHRGTGRPAVWVNIINDKSHRGCQRLVGKGYITTQKEIWQRVTGKTGLASDDFNTAQTTQGRRYYASAGGESLSRLGTLQTGIGMAASRRIWRCLGCEKPEGNQCDRTAVSRWQTASADCCPKLVEPQSPGGLKGYSRNPKAAE